MDKDGNVGKAGRLSPDDESWTEATAMQKSSTMMSELGLLYVGFSVTCFSFIGYFESLQWL